jgi:hypothetical protein
MSWSWEDVQILREGLIAANKPPSLSFRVFARLTAHPQMGPEAHIYDLPQAEFNIVFSDPSISQQCAGNVLTKVDSENHSDATQARGGMVEFDIDYNNDTVSVVLPALKVTKDIAACTMVTLL